MIPFNRADVLDLLFDSETQLTARAYVLKIADHLSISRSRAKTILQFLVNQQELAYQDLYGSTYVVKSFLKPVRVTDRFFISPPEMQNQAGPGELTIRIIQGISFGSGHHPTTLICLEAIEKALIKTSRPDIPKSSGGRGGDIGTGSGVLAIAMVLAGMDHCQAWEIDPNAVSEAGQNIQANGLSDKISLHGTIMPGLKKKLSFICANLRFPTLKKIAPLIKSNLESGGTLILSGIRPWETNELTSHYADLGFTLISKREKKGWSGIVMEKAV